MGRLVKTFGRLVPAEVLDARAQAEAILIAARAEAAELLAAARGQADAIRAEARLQGDAAGRRDAETAFTVLMIEARADAERTRGVASVAARTLAMRMAEKIVARVVQLDPTAVAGIAAEALAEARARAGIVVLRVHPDDLAALEAARPTLAARIATAVELRLMADPAVGRTGCVVETPVGRLDARLETQLAALERAVFGDGGVAAGRAIHG
jgi:flagellar biosynthesis/type III secretory pathway protein FliH